MRRSLIIGLLVALSCCNFGACSPKITDGSQIVGLRAYNLSFVDNRSFLVRDIVNTMHVYGYSESECTLSDNLHIARRDGNELDLLVDPCSSDNSAQITCGAKIETFLLFSPNYNLHLDLERNRISGREWLELSVKPHGGSDRIVFDSVSARLEVHRHHSASRTYELEGVSLMLEGRGAGIDSVTVSDAALYKDGCEVWTGCIDMYDRFRH